MMNVLDGLDTQKKSSQNDNSKKKKIISKYGIYDFEPDTPNILTSDLKKNPMKCIKKSYPPSSIPKNRSHLLVALQTLNIDIGFHGAF